MSNSTKHAEEKIIFAHYNEKTIRVYQAYNHKIADEAVELGSFGASFKMERMTWIKPSFLWMMYRSGWGTKIDQERILAIDISREGFDAILSDVVLSSFHSDAYVSLDEWKLKLQNSQVRCQWDPDRDIHGNPLHRRAVQLGLKGDMVENYVHKWIVEVNDITEHVIQIREAIQLNSFEVSMLPNEREYHLDDCIQRTLGMVTR
ncbi:hypothetical protein GCM10008018_42290 [Paenibacillus marchantiophytorum]|uniref:DUF4291 domain-containing protein n=1 Tax=Paenibacillus marchantiophytorum TaxID=1619310 RepID=A0ABQ1EX84_9BACL|nr:DUF4291 domain-containing protein [Paenibacillus marchantiophytorum]GFZ91567.1 hypothetical protein GCM10008018_42290 [Paenibacillus marchantiophytorum]